MRCDAGRRFRPLSLVNVLFSWYYVLYVMRLITPDWQKWRLLLKKCVPTLPVCSSSCNRSEIKRRRSFCRSSRLYKLKCLIIKIIIITTTTKKKQTPNEKNVNGDEKNAVNDDANALQPHEQHVDALKCNYYNNNNSKGKTGC